VTNVRRGAGAAVLPLVAAAVGIGVGATPADAAICSPLSSASITGPSGTVTAGSTVHARARVSGMLLSAHMQITGPGLNQQVGPSAISGVIEGDVRVPQPGAYTLKVMGNGTGCVYDTDSFSAKERATTSKPSPQRSGGGASGGGRTARTSRLPKRVPNNGSTGLRTPGSGSPFRLPSVTPDGSGPSLRYPSSDPQVAAPPIRQPQPQANNAAQTVPPIKWGQSIGIALVLLLLSAHMGMWSRRQRLAEAGGRGRGTRPDTPVAPPTPRDTPADPCDRATPLATNAAFSGTPEHPGNGPENRTPLSDRSDPTGPTAQASPVGAESWTDPRSQTRTTGRSSSADLADRAHAGESWTDPRSQTGPMGRPGTVGREDWTDPRSRAGSTDQSGAVDWESWVGTRRQMGAADRMNSRGWAGTAGRSGSANQADAADWATVAPSGVSSNGENSLGAGVGSPGRGGGSAGRTARSSRGTYRGRRRRS
jgi:hypothetical protein